MQDKKVIDHLLFRKLFAETFGVFNIDGYHGHGGDDYVIGTSCVRWKQTEEDFLQEFGHFMGPVGDTTITLLEIIQRATLAFPCSPAQALEWANNNRDTGAAGDGPSGFIYVPDWLIEALGQADAEAAMNVLSAVAAELDAAVTIAEANGDIDEQKSARSERGHLMLAMEAFEEIRRLLPTTSQSKAQPVRRITAAEANQSKLLLAIADAGLNETSLPRSQKGKAGAKSQVTRFALKRGLTKAQFKTAWEAAFRDSAIRYKE